MTIKKGNFFLLHSLTEVGFSTHNKGPIRKDLRHFSETPHVIVLNLLGTPKN